MARKSVPGEAKSTVTLLPPAPELGTSGLVCPDCRGDLIAAGDESLRCTFCERQFLTDEGVASLLPSSVPLASREDIRAWDEPDSGRIEHRAGWRALLGKEAQIRHLDQLLDSRDWSDLRVLEIGGGMCWASLVVKDRFPTAQLTATDVAASALSKARSVACELSLQADRYLAVDVHRLPLADDQFDIVFGSEMLHHLEEPVEALREIRRVLRPSGRYLGIGEGAASVPMQWLFDKTGLHRRLGGHEASRYAMKEALYSVSRWRKMFLDAGFSTVSATPAIEPTQQYQSKLRLYYYCGLSMIPRTLAPALGCAVTIDAAK